jgi:hypothetical protein
MRQGQSCHRVATVAVGVFAATLTLLLHTSAARAGEADEGDVGREHYRKGRHAFDMGRFAEAAHEYEQAYAANGSPALLYILGQAHRLAGNGADALVAYKAFLRDAPDTPKRADVEQRIQELETTPTAPATSPPATSPLATPPPRPIEMRPSLLQAAPTQTRAPRLRLHLPYKKWWFWTAAAGVASAAVIVIAVGATQGQPRETAFLVPSP